MGKFSILTRKATAFLMTCILLVTPAMPLFQAVPAFAAVIDDTNAPVLQSFTSSTVNGPYGVGATVTIIANFDEDLDPGSTMTVTLDTGAVVTLNVVVGSTLSGTYTVAG